MYRKILGLTVAAMLAMSLAVSAAAEDNAAEDENAVIEETTTEGEYVAEEDGVVEEEGALENEGEEINDENTVEDETLNAENTTLTGIEDKGADTGVGSVAVATAIALVATGAVIFSRKKK